MFRVIFYLIVSVFLITIVRGFLRIILRGFADLVRPQPARQGSGARAEMPLHGELKKDPVCGTYVSAAASIKESIQGETLYFCSPQCRDKYAAR